MKSPLKSEHLERSLFLNEIIDKFIKKFSSVTAWLVKSLLVNDSESHSRSLHCKWIADSIFGHLNPVYVLVFVVHLDLLFKLALD